MNNPMKKSILFLLLIASISVGAQKEWAPIGTTWYYDFYAQEATGYVKIESFKDTVVASKPCRFLLITESAYEYPGVYKTYKLDSLITYQEGDKVFLFNNNKFVLIYDFNPTVGDIWDLTDVPNYFNFSTISPNPYHPACPGGKIVVDSIKTMTFENQSFKAIYTSPYQNSQKHYFGVIVEGIGCLNYLLPLDICNRPMDIPAAGNIRCYNTSGFSHSWSLKACDYLPEKSRIDFLKTGTQWYYGEKDYIFPPANTFNDNYFSVKITGETIVKGKNCKVMQHLRSKPMCFGYDDTVSIYQSNDTVYFYNTTSQKFSTLYVYNAQKGDSWDIDYPNTKVTATLDSIGSEIIFGQLLKVQYVTYSMVFPKGNGILIPFSKSKIIEGMGDKMYYFNSNIYWMPLCDESAVYTGLRCYFHPDFETYHVPGTLDCAYVTEVPKQNYNTLKVSLNFLGILSIDGDLSTEPCTFELLDLKGSIMLKTTVNTSQNTVNLSRYDKGLYLYRISGKDGLLKAGKIVKN